MFQKRRTKQRNGRKIKGKIGLLIAGTIFLAAAGIFLPGILIERQESGTVGEVQEVPAQYISSDSLLAKEASKSLKMTERLQLVTGQWESDVTEADGYEMTLQDYEAAALARNSMEEIYNRGEYPCNLASSYANWYTWEAVPMKAVDTTFHTYSAYYWMITFIKYDGTEKDVVFMLEDGTILLAQAEGTDFTTVLDSGSNGTLKKLDERRKEEFSYSGLDMEDLWIKSESTSVEEDTEYQILELYNSSKAVYGILAISDSQTGDNMVK